MGLGNAVIQRLPNVVVVAGLLSNYREPVGVIMQIYIPILNK